MNESETVVSSFCAVGNCVGVQRVEGGVYVFNTSNHASPGFFASEKEWGEFLKGVKNGDFDDVVPLTPVVGNHVAGTEGGRSTLDVGADSGLI